MAMDRVEDAEQMSYQSASAGSALPSEVRLADAASGPFSPQALIEPCPTCVTPAADGATGSSFVYAIGEIDWQFSSESLANEFAQVLANTEDARRLPPLQAEKKILSENRYIARQLCWVLKIEKLQTYILQPRDPADVKLLVDALRPDDSRLDIDIIIGVRGPIAPPEICNGLGLPIVIFDQLYYFDRPALIKSLPRPPKAKPREFESTAEGVLRRIQQLTDNHGATDEHRAVNYLAVRSPEIYANASQRLDEGYWLTAIDVVPSRLSGSRGRKVLDVIFTYTNTTSRIVRKWFVRVDVTGEFPFIVTPLQEYFDR
jgi:PatG C-terminal